MAVIPISPGIIIGDQEGRRRIDSVTQAAGLSFTTGTLVALLQEAVEPFVERNLGHQGARIHPPICRLRHGGDATILASI